MSNPLHALFDEIYFHQPTLTTPPFIQKTPKTKIIQLKNSSQRRREALCVKIWKQFSMYFVELGQAGCNVNIYANVSWFLNPL